MYKNVSVCYDKSGLIVSGKNSACKIQRGHYNPATIRELLPKSYGRLIYPGTAKEPILLENYMHQFLNRWRT